MALVVDANALSPTCNSYVTVGECSTYVDSRIVDSTVQQTWDNLDPAVQAAYVVNATRSLDAMGTWIGDKYTRDQRLKWPRANAWIENFQLDVDVVPQAIKDATCELAAWMASNGGAVSVQNSETLDRVKVGPIQVQFNVDDGQAPYSYFPDIIAYILKDYGMLGDPAVPGSRTAHTVGLIRS